MGRENAHRGFRFKVPSLMEVIPVFKIDKSVRNLELRIYTPYLSNITPYTIPTQHHTSTTLSSPSTSSIKTHIDAQLNLNNSVERRKFLNLLSHLQVVTLTISISQAIRKQ